MDLPYGRAKALALLPLANGGWWSVRELADYVQEHPSFFAGLDHAAARKAVLRAIRELEKFGMAETKMETGQRGLPVLRVRRRLTDAENEAEQQQLMAEVAAEQGAEATEVAV